MISFVRRHGARTSRIQRDWEKIRNTFVPAASRSGFPPRRRFPRKEMPLVEKKVDPRLVREREQLAHIAAQVGSLYCRGCGALLQSLDPTQIGYLDESKLETCRAYQRTPATPSPPAVCLRCQALRAYQKLIHVDMKEEEYRKVMMEKISHRNCLILWLVDIVDFPSSLNCSISDIIGPNNPVVLVATKMDLLNGPRKDIEQCVRNSLLEGWRASEVGKKCNLAAIHVISAGAADGVKELIRDVNRQWGARGDVFVVGSANAGKSTLFNRLLPLMCGVSARGLGGATVSHWPGTTLRMLRLPILSHDRQKSLKEEAMEELRRRMTVREEKGRQKNQTKKIDPDSEFFKLMEGLRQTRSEKDSEPHQPFKKPNEKEEDEDVEECRFDDSEFKDIVDSDDGVNMKAVDRAMKKLKLDHFDGGEVEGFCDELIDPELEAVEEENSAGVGAEAGTQAPTEQTAGQPSSVKLQSLKQPGKQGSALEAVKKSSLVENEDQQFQSMLQLDPLAYLYDTPGLLHTEQVSDVRKPLCGVGVSALQITRRV